MLARQDADSPPLGKLRVREVPSPTSSHRISSLARLALAGPGIEGGSGRRRSFTSPLAADASDSCSTAATPSPSAHFKSEGASSFEVKLMSTFSTGTSCKTSSPSSMHWKSDCPDFGHAKMTDSPSLGGQTARMHLADDCVVVPCPNCEVGFNRLHNQVAVLQSSVLTWQAVADARTWTRREVETAASHSQCWQKTLLSSVVCAHADRVLRATLKAWSRCISRRFRCDELRCLSRAIAFAKVEHSKAYLREMLLIWRCLFVARSHTIEKTVTLVLSAWKPYARTCCGIPLGVLFGEWSRAACRLRSSSANSVVAGASIPIFSHVVPSSSRQCAPQPQKVPRDHLAAPLIDSASLCMVHQPSNSLLA
mmetsp:Transcript_131653/g.421180  ORF Transcript_131653/g.421180 Transcript_131653/m.421180 type:complete len:366 (-) Transcript_131653:156-1253(-)